MSTTATHLITDHDSNGKSIISETVNDYAHKIPVPFGTLECLYSTPVLPPDLTSPKDLEETKQNRIHGLSNHGSVTPDDGLAVSLVNFKPAQSSVMHRTKTLDLGVVVEGEVELELDGRVTRRLKAGDTVVQRGTLHRWRNVSPADGWLRMYFVSVDAKPILVDGKELREEFMPD